MYVLGNPGPYIQLGMPPIDVGIAGGYTLATAFGPNGGGYSEISVDATKSVAGVKCEILYANWNGVHAPYKNLWCVDRDGNIGIMGKVFTTDHPKPLP